MKIIMWLIWHRWKFKAGANAVNKLGAANHVMFTALALNSYGCMKSKFIRNDMLKILEESK